MANDPRSAVAGKSLDEVADFMAGVTQGSLNDQMARAEFLLRQTKSQEEAAAAAKTYTRYMFWSVVILALSAVTSLGVNLFTLAEMRQANWISMQDRLDKISARLDETNKRVQAVEWASPTLRPENAQPKNRK